MFNPIRFLKNVFKLSHHVDLYATLKWNFKIFPFKIARKLPLFLGYNVDIQNYSGGGGPIEC